MEETKYTVVEFGNINDLEDYLKNLDNGYQIFRGQAQEPNLTTSIERHCMKSNYSLSKDCLKIERNMIRQFDRVYDGTDKQKVHDDILYRLSLMRHFGAPTRLLDFTYSRYIAIYFALESAYNNIPKKKLNKIQHDLEKYELDYKKERNCSIWCIDFKKLDKKS